MGNLKEELVIELLVIFKGEDLFEIDPPYNTSSFNIEGRILNESVFRSTDSKLKNVVIISNNYYYVER